MTQNQSYGSFSNFLLILLEDKYNILKSHFCSCNLLLDKLELTRLTGGQDKEASSLNPILWDGPLYETSVCSIQGKDTEQYDEEQECHCESEKDDWNNQDNTLEEQDRMTMK